eukprot:TRINITY_DN56013_c0_g1_i1.p1 TRINITY_DN56013_c0_g1~~TRINITY_DN56013_c0_g1_i1.p1  ORF type:complete len:891 (+),score=144.39 TRINITY_DN56013_c0_g1_i1:82-2754(+)
MGLLSRKKKSQSEEAEALLQIKEEEPEDDELPENVQVPPYWTHARKHVSKNFDQMVYLDRRKHEMFDDMLRSTYREKCTRDRPCPKGTCAKRAGGCACNQPGANPGLPTSFRVRRVIRVEDSFMWAKYVQKREEIREKRAEEALEPFDPPMQSDEVADMHPELFGDLDNSVNEVYLWHGTNVRAALSIAQDDFRIDLAGDNTGTMYGRGAYCAESSTKADEYATDEPGGYYEGVYAMLLCRATMGKYYYTEEREESAGDKVLAGDYDSTLGDRLKSVGTFRELVIYDSDQIYPEYIVVYTRVFHQDDPEEVEKKMEVDFHMELPVYWRDCHVNPTTSPFSSQWVVRASTMKLIQRLVAGCMDGTPAKVVRARRIENSQIWCSYIDYKRKLKGELEDRIAKGVDGTEEDAPELIPVRVPDGASAGTKIQIKHGGLTLQLTVPPGVSPGGVFRVQIPGAKKGPPGCSCMGHGVCKACKVAAAKGISNLPTSVKPIRPARIPSVSVWLTAGCPELAKDTGRFYHEVKLADNFKRGDKPQLGWLSVNFEEGPGNGCGVGSDEHGWGLDGATRQHWHNGPQPVEWKKRWRAGDVIGFAVDLDAGKMVFSLNGEWVSSADMDCDTSGAAIYPAVSTYGFFAFHIPREAWQFSPPDEDYEPWAEKGVFTRPVPKKGHFMEAEELDGDISSGHVRTDELLRKMHAEDCISLDNLEDALNEHMLWHGTSKEAAEAIVRNDFKIARGKAKHGKRFGQGAYFAEGLDKSLSYVEPDEDGRIYVLLCRVVCGDYYYTEQRVETDAHEKCKKAGKHSILANPEKEGPREFVILNECCVYPEFCLEIDVQGEVEDWMMEPDAADEEALEAEKDDAEVEAAASMQLEQDDQSKSEDVCCTLCVLS